jgi:hypothetical protein
VTSAGSASSQKFNRGKFPKYAGSGSSVRNPPTRSSALVLFLLLILLSRRSLLKKTRDALTGGAFKTHYNYRGEKAKK